MTNTSKTDTSANLAFASTIVQQLDVLSVRRKEWEATEYKKANDGLYSLLADCLSIFQQRFVNGSEADQKALRSSLIQRLQADGVRVVKTSTTLTMLARFVFNSDRKRAQGYAYVMAAAVSHGIDAADLPKFINQSGGIEEIKRKMVKKPEAIARQNAVSEAKLKVESEVELASIAPLAQVSISGLSGDYAILLAKPNPNGTAMVVGTLSDVNEALFNSLMMRMAKSLVDKQAAEVQIEKEKQYLMATVAVVSNESEFRKAA
jgi:hypothetical protein